MAPDLRRALDRLATDARAAAAHAGNGLRYLTAGDAEVAPTPKDRIWRRHQVELWRYRTGATPTGPPLLIIHSLVGRSYIFDLQPGNSAVATLLDRGLDVFLLDFGAPDAADADNGLETYAWDYIPQAVSATCAASGSPEVPVLGYCLGGVLSVLALAGPDPPPISALVTMAMPFDFEHMRVLASFARAGRLGADELLDETGNVPADNIARLFPLVRPTSGLAQKVTLVQHLGNPAYLEGHRAMNRWVHDHVPLPGNVARQLVEHLIRDNALVRGGMRLAGHTVDPAAVACPFLNVVGENDTLVPAGAALPATRRVGDGANDQLLLPGGHVSLFSGRSASRVALPRIEEWLRGRTHRDDGAPANAAASSRPGSPAHSPTAPG